MVVHGCCLARVSLPMCYFSASILLLGLMSAISARRRGSTSSGPRAWVRDALAGYLADLFLQNFNVSLGRATPVAAMDRSTVIRWLDLSTDLDADSRYPMLLAARHFAESGTPEQRKSMLGWIYQRFQERPNERWPWQVHAVFAARHVLHDNALAETYAAALRTRVTDPAAPSWVAQMDFLLRADLGEAEDARAILAGLIDAGQIRSPGELKFLESRIAAAQPPLPNL